MHISTKFGASLVLTASIVSLVAPAIQAVQLADGTVSFEKAPDLISATTTYNSTYMWGATYYFTLQVPENAGEPLGQVTIRQNEGVDDIEFELKDTRAFEGTARHKGEKLTLKEVTRDSKTRTITVRFDPSVKPGKTFTIALRPVRNPDTGGAYIFGVTAFPAAEKPYGIYLGVGRLQFYERGRDSFPF